METVGDERPKPPIKKKPGRVGGRDWQHDRPGVFGVYTAAYSPSGTPLRHGPKPWTVVGPKTFETFPTWHQAIHYAFREAGK